MTAVTGTLVLPGDAPMLDGVSAAVRVREITFSDAPAEEPVQEKEMRVDVIPGAQIAFDIDVPDEWLERVSRRQCELNLEVHIDRDGNDVFSPGDFVSMNAHPVTRDTVGIPMEVPLVMV
jgi:hypothetical protein